MKTKNLLQLKNYLLKVWIIGVLTGFVVFGTALKANAQKYELTGNKSSITQTTEITLSGSTPNKFYYLFRVDDADQLHFVTFMVGQGFPLQYAPQQTAGKYVVYEFNQFKGMPFDSEKHQPSDGIKQTGEVSIIIVKN